VRSEGSLRQNRGPTNRNLIRKAGVAGRVSMTSRSPKVPRDAGKWGGRAVKVHVLIRGDLNAWRSSGDDSTEAGNGKESDEESAEVTVATAKPTAGSNR